MIYLIDLITLILSRSNHGNPSILLITVKTYSPTQQHGHHALLDLPRLGQFPFERGDFAVQCRNGTSAYCVGHIINTKLLDEGFGPPAYILVRP